jgi:hypothetical protein
MRNIIAESDPRHDLFVSVMCVPSSQAKNAFSEGKPLHVLKFSAGNQIRETKRENSLKK